MLSLRRRHALSNLISTLLLIVMTLIAGAVLFGYVNGQAASSENQLGAANASNVNFLNERFVIAQASFDYTNGKSVTLYVYDSGRLADSFVRIEMFGNPRSGVDLVYYVHSHNNWVMDVNHAGCNSSATISPSLESPSLSAYSVPIGSISSITLSIPSNGRNGWGGSCFSNQLVTNSTYGFNLLGAYGNAVTYFQVM
jgi:flagellin-like protein